MKLVNYFYIYAVLFLFLRLTPPVPAQDGPVVVLSSFPDIPLAGSAWTLSLSIDHSEPDEVTVNVPSFDEALLLDQILKMPRSIDLSSNGRPWTTVEYRFILQSPETVTLDSFIVITPQGQTRTVPFTIGIQSPDGETMSPRLRLTWQAPPPTLTAGEAARIGLCVSGWDSRLPFPEPALLEPPVPKGFIMEASPPAPEDKSAAVVLWLRVIPLDARVLEFPRRTVSVADIRFEIPPLRIPVRPAPAPAPAAPGGPVSAPPADAPLHVPPAPPFPAAETAVTRHPYLPGFFRTPFERIYETARDLWAKGNRAGALAELRRNERDHPAGPLFASVRREAEHNLGIDRTEDEKSRVTRITAFMVCLCLAIVSGPVCCRFLPPSWRKKAGFVCAILCAAAIIFLWQYIEEGKTLSGRSRSGVIKEETFIRRVPEISGEVTGRFREGRPVRLLPDTGKNGSWVWVFADGEEAASGWVEKDKLEFY